MAGQLSGGMATPASACMGKHAPHGRGAHRAHLVVTYHYIREQNSDGVTGVTPQEFAEQIRAIQAQYRVVTVEEFAVQHVHEGGLAVITFDDALRDQAVAASILDDHGLPGVFFAPMRPYSDEPDHWCPQHLLHALADELGWAELKERVSPHLAGVEIDTDEADRLYHYEVPHKRRLKYALAFALPAAEAAAALREVNVRIGLRADDWYLTAAQLRALEDAGHALGGHGFDHVPYNTLSAQAQAADMHRAVHLMNKLFGTLPRALAYPFGRFTPVTAALARACGYIHTFTTEDRVDAKFVRDEIARRATVTSGPRVGRRPVQES